jgi:hypothetical protein
VGNLIEGWIDGVCFFALTGGVVWISWHHGSQIGYSITLIVMGFMLALWVMQCVLRRAISRLRRELSLEKQLRSSGGNPHRTMLYEASLSVEPAGVQPKKRMIERLEEWMELFKKYAEDMFRAARLLCGLACVGAGIAALFYHQGGRPWTASPLLVAGGAFLGTKTLLDHLQRPRGKK